jgi:hypothetical protein
MDIYSTYALNRVVERLVPRPTFFLDTFFPNVITSDKEEIYFDVTNDRARMTPFVHPMREGKLIEDKGFSTKSFKPAYVKDKRNHVPTKALKRRAGEAFGGTLSPEQRLAAVLASDLMDQKEMLTSRLEAMAAEAVMYGRQTIIGDGFDAVVNFGRDSALTIALAGTNKWNDSAKTNQTDDLEEWSQLLLEKSGSGSGVCVMGATAWKLFKRDTKIDKLLDKEYKGGDGSNLEVAPRFRVEGASYKGKIGDFEIWVYSNVIVDPENGTSSNLMPANGVLMASATNLDGVRHFGAIQDLDAGLQARESFTKSWVIPEPSARILLMQSAPLLVPYRTNSSLFAIVT